MKGLIRIIENSYSIEEIVDYHKIKEDSSTFTYILNTGYRKYILRKLRNREQGDSEYNITNYLKNSIDNISSILKTEDNIGYIIYKNNYYNLQNYIEGSKIEKIDNNILNEIIKSINTFHNTLSKTDIRINSIDRFDLINLWEESKYRLIRDYEYFLKNNFNEEYIKNLYSKTDYNKDIIHGDLGIQNLIWTGKKVIIIDFGESRLGSFYFDIASIICSIVGFNKNEEYIKDILIKFYENYKINESRIKIKELFYYIELWYIRGVLTIILNNPLDKKDKEKLINNSFNMIERFYVIINNKF